MRTQQEIKARIAELRGDPRFSYPDANVMVNAPLAIIQIELKSRVQALEWTLGSGEAS